MSDKVFINAEDSTNITCILKSKLVSNNDNNIINNSIGDIDNDTDNDDDDEYKNIKYIKIK
jgi:hypothetical protein